jgi:hypothetical protein
MRGAKDGRAATSPTDPKSTLGERLARVERRLELHEPADA